MTDAVYIEIPYPAPSANAIWRNANGHVYLSEQYKEFLRAAQYEICGKRAPAEWPYYDVTVVVYPRRKQGDTDNRIKPTLDVLTKCGYWADDKLVARSSSYFGPCDKRGRTLVIIRGAASKFPFKPLTQEPQ